MKMVVKLMEMVEGVEIYPIISLIIFLSIFLGVTYYVFRAKKGYFKDVSNYPLNDD